MTFRVGQLVCCVSDGDGDRVDGEPWPMEGQIFTISELEWVEGELGVRVEELPPPIETDESHSWYMAEIFRPVVTPSIEVFTAMLNPVRQDA